MRSATTWQLRTRSLELGRRTLIMGVVNITPDSFSDGGSFFAPDAAVDEEHTCCCLLSFYDAAAQQPDIAPDRAEPDQR